MRLSYRLVLSLATALVLATGAGMFGLYELNVSNQTYARIIEVDYANVQAVNRMLVDFKAQVQELKDTLLRGKDPQLRGKHWAGFQMRQQAVIEESRQLLSSLPEGKARVLVAKFTDAHAQMDEGYRKGLQAFEESNFDYAIGDAAVRGIDRPSAELLKQASEQTIAGSAAGVATAARSSAVARTVSLSLMLAVMVIGIIGSLLIAREITRPLNDTVQV
jgi:hypothetical protein